MESDTPATPEEPGLRSSLSRNFPAPLVVDALMLSRLPPSGGEWTCLQEVTVPNPARLSQGQPWPSKLPRLLFQVIMPLCGSVTSHAKQGIR